MTDKLEALSQPVAVMFADGYVMTREECGNTFAACCQTQSPLYSQEYVTALLAALEEKDQRIKEFERITEGVDQLAIDGGWTARGMSEYAKARDAENQDLMLTVGRLRTKCERLEQRLQQPIKLRSKVFEMMNVGGGHSIQVVSVKTVKEIIRTAGFKVKVEGE